VRVPQPPDLFVFCVNRAPIPTQASDHPSILVRDLLTVPHFPITLSTTQAQLREHALMNQLPMSTEPRRKTLVLQQQNQTLAMPSVSCFTLHEYLPGAQV
jgi:hypothetical protein